MRSRISKFCSSHNTSTTYDSIMIIAVCHLHELPAAAAAAIYHTRTSFANIWFDCSTVTDVCLLQGLIRLSFNLASIDVVTFTECASKHRFVS